MLSIWEFRLERLFLKASIHWDVHEESLVLAVRGSELRAIYSEELHLLHVNVRVDADFLWALRKYLEGRSGEMMSGVGELIQDQYIGMREFRV